jgi:hypothetical protein
VDTVASGAVKYIQTLPDVLALVGSYSPSDPEAANQGLPWVFSGDLFQTIEGTSSAALVCSDFGHFSVAPPLTTPQFLRLAVAIWADPLRDGNGNVTESSGRTVARAREIFTTLNFHLHRTTGDPQLWGDVNTVGCQLLTGPNFMPVEDIGAAHPAAPGFSSRPHMGTAYYGVSVFGWTDLPS